MTWRLSRGGGSVNDVHEKRYQAEDRGPRRLQAKVLGASLP